MILANLRAKPPTSLKAAPNIIVTRGNHDGAGERREFQNLRTFGEEWTSYEYDDVVISGIEMAPSNADIIAQYNVFSTLK